jgi:crotonobetainyl-CoA:carnitine CoA-transferase CaiB-like acyl-CoA transferase
MAVTLTGPALALGTCARRLAPLGATPSHGLDEDPPGAGRLVLDWEEGPGAGGPDLEVELSWFGPATMGDRRGSEAVIQAVSGLMAVHGRDAGGPRRLGLEVASVAAGVLAGHSVLAALVGRSRGVPVARIEGSVLQAALLLVSHRVAAATAGSEWVPAPPAPAPGPPFASAEGDWFEIETLDPSAWRAFWERLGATEELGWAWQLFRPRYFRGTCTLPAGLHEATRTRPLAEIVAAAQACGVSLSRVRSYEEVLESPGCSQGHPIVRALHGTSGAPGGAPQAAPGSGSLPLAGLRVVEATSRLQGPLAGLLLQMLGAHVVRVEPPGGDPSRSVPPLAGETGSFHLAFNRGKEPVELDLGRPQGRADLAELVADADVFLQNWRPGKAAEWGLAADDLAAANPRLVYGYASGWGDLPGVAHMVGTDFLVQAYAGVGAGIHPEGQAPLPSRALLTDYMGALATCEAVLWGLYLRERTGRGQRVDASLLAGAMALQAHVLEALAAGREKGRRGGRPVWSLLDHPLETADGVLVVAVEDDDGLHRLCRACAVDPDQPAREAVEALVAQRIARGSAVDWEERLTGAAIPCAAACTDLAALPADARLSGCFEPLAGSAWVPTAPWRLSGSNG